MVIQEFCKDPDAQLDFSVDWTAWLAGDIITSSSWTVDGAGVVMAFPAPTFSATITTAWMSGGTAGQLCHLTNTIFTNGQRKDQRTLAIKIVEK
jgi:hypothetical protein